MSLYYTRFNKKTFNAKDTQAKRHGEGNAPQDKTVAKHREIRGDGECSE